MYDIPFDDRFFRDFRVANYCFLYIAHLQILATMKALMCDQLYANVLC
jgi:hypothetical protein